VRSDLDGDGAAEVVVVAERLTDPNQPPAVGDYSVAFLRRSVGGGVETTVLDSSVAQAVDPPGFPFLSYLRLSAVADLNGDGRTELLLGAREYESAWTRAYELEADGNVVAVLDVGCGL
jgi:FG-GAP repeat